MRCGVVGVLVVLAACGGNPTDTVGATVPHTGPATDLAPSQVAASTVPRPMTPPPCDVAELTFWTAQVFRGERTADAVVRVRNDGEAWCEVDVDASPLIDPAIEPDVWLEPDGWADLVVGQRSADCIDPAVETSVRVDVHGEAIDVPTAVVTCGWWLSAFYPSDPAVDSCPPGELDLVVTETELIVRNPTFVSCTLGSLVGSDGTGTVASTGDRVPITSLAGGDVASFRLRRPGGTDCDADQPTTLTFEAAGDVEVPGLGRCVVVELGPAGPWYDTANGTLQHLSDAEVGVALAALDPFVDGA